MYELYKYNLKCSTQTETENMALEWQEKEWLSPTGISFREFWEKNLWFMPGK